MVTHTFEYGTGGPILFWGMFPHREKELEQVVTAIRQVVLEESYTLIVFEVQDWNREFSPWSSPKLEKSFAGGADKTLQWLVQEEIPKVRAQYGSDRERYLIGYSLAGLFALWALAETDVFSGAASCSGSLWYPDFVPYLQKKEIRNARIYLSLGGKEAKTGNPMMATIADCTREVEQYLKKTNKVRFEMNPGGHFADSGKRLAKAVKWIVKS